MPGHVLGLDDEQRRPWLLLLALDAIMAVVSLVGAVMGVLVTEDPELAAISGAASLGYALNLVLLRRSTSNAMSGHVFLTILTVHATAVVVLKGQVWTLGPMQALILAIMAVQVLGRRAGVAWAVISQLVLVVMGYLQMAVLDTEPSWFLGSELADRIGITVSQISLVFALIWFQDSSRSRAQEASSFKSAVLASMSHELRTPLNGVLGMLEDLASEDLPAEIRQRVVAALGSGTSLLEIVDDAIDLFQAEAGSLSMDVAAFDLREGLEVLRERRVAQAGKRRVDVHLDYLETLPSWFLGDGRQVLRVVDKLVDNALKFTDRGHVYITVEYTPASRVDLPRLTVKVEDTGIGIPADQQATVFDRFTQVDDSWDRTRGGTGLGLAVSRELVSSMGGEIGVQSVEGKGSTFSVVLPLAATAAPKAQSVEAQPAPPELTVPLRALVVEDNMVNQMVARRLLQRLELEVEVAGNGREALERLRGGKYDVVFMDVQMPVMDGLEATRIIRESSDPVVSSVPIVALTAYSTRADRQRCLDVGMNGHVGKPIELKRIVAELKRLTAWRGQGWTTSEE